MDRCAGRLALTPTECQCYARSPSISNRHPRVLTEGFRHLLALDANPPHDLAGQMVPDPFRSSLRVGDPVSGTMETVVSEAANDQGDEARRRLVELYDDAVGEVYGYLARRCESPAVAEELTSETFLAAADAVVRRPPPDLTIAWLIGIARHKLADHWRRREREERLLVAVEAQPDPPDETWDIELDRIVAHGVLAELGPHHRGALTLRYVDGLPVREVAAHLGRTEKATEVLLVRARAAFRDRYGAHERRQR